MRHTIREMQALRGIGQHKVYERDRLRLSDVTGMLLFIGLIVFLLWFADLQPFSWEHVR